MNNTKYFNDAPINSPEYDRFGIEPFAKAIALSIRDIISPVGVTIAINGPWGSGKSSAVNLVRHHLTSDEESGKVKIIDFKCWWFRGEEALTLAFLQELNSSLAESIGDKAKGLMPQLGKKLLQAGHVLGAAVNLISGGVYGAVSSGAVDFAKLFFSDNDNLDKIFQELSTALEQQNKRFLVVIDDIDRLTPDEALLIFRLVKSVGRLPNVIYLLAFDRELAEKAVAERYPSEGPHFLEKIIQASFEIPLPVHDDLNMAILEYISTLGNFTLDDKRKKRFLNVFYDAVAPYLKTPRDLARLVNSMTVTWPAVGKEVNIADFVALEAMRLFEPLLYATIRSSKNRVCGIRSHSDKYDEVTSDICGFLDRIPQHRRDFAKRALERLFPRFERMEYTRDFLDSWEAERRVCTREHFDTYFRFSIGDETISVDDIAEFCKRCGEKEYVRKLFLGALGSIRRNGKSRVPTLLDEIRIHSSQIEKHKFQPLISALFEVADDIDRDADSTASLLEFGDNFLRISWLVRALTRERCSIEERSTIFEFACETACLGWFVDFAASAVRDYFPSDGEQPEIPAMCLVSRESSIALKDKAVGAIEAASENGVLIAHQRLGEILFRWREFTNANNSRIKEWTVRQLGNGTAVAQLARAFTSDSTSLSVGMFGLGDRVTTRTVKAQISGLDDVIDVEKFRQRLEELESNTSLDGTQQQYIQIFLQAWRNQEKKGSD